MGLYALPKILSDLVRSFKSAANGKVLTRNGGAWTFADPQSGPPGDPGPSAYDVAISNGFVGTEAEWLASLVGDTGTAGDQGPAGDPVSRDGLKTYHGFVTRANSTLAFNNGTRTFTLGNTAPHDVWHNGVKTAVNTAKSVQIGAGLGQHFIWMDAAGALATSQVVWDLLNTAIIFVATVHWDGATGIIGDERHDYRRNLIENRNQHESWGAQYVSGFTPSPTFTDANTFTFAGGVIRDEDLYHTLNTPQTTCRIGYRVAGGATMTFDAAGTAYAKLSAGVPQYDNAGTLTALSSSRYMNHWVYATNRPDTPVVVILGQNSYTTVAAAQNGAQPTLAGLAVAEWKLLYRVIGQNLAGALKFIQADTLYNLSTGPAINAGTPTTLSAGNVTVNVSNFGGNLTASETSVQAALDKIDDLALASSLVDLTGASEDYALPVGGAASITFTATTSVPLHILTNGGEFEMTIQGDTSIAIGTQAPISLLANNTTYAAGSFKLLSFGCNGAFTDSPAVITPQTAYKDMATYTKLAVAFSLAVRVFAKFSTSTKSKSATVQSIGLRTGPNMWLENYGIYWNDTSTAWSSLGTLEFPFAQSGKILIRRVA